MKVIWKFPLILGRSQEIKMPSGAQILTVQEQFNEPMMWALVETNNPIESRWFDIFGTGHDIYEVSGKERIYINTFQVDAGNYVFHVFELKS